MAMGGSSYSMHQELINTRTEAIFAALHLKSFVLRLPIANVADAEKTRQGIYEKILKNRSYSCTRSNPRDELTRQPDPEVSAAQTAEIVALLSAPSTVGFVLVVVEEAVQNSKTGGQPEYCPVGGGIVEVIDEHERSIRGLWYVMADHSPLSIYNHAVLRVGSAFTSSLRGPRRARLGLY